MDKIINLHFASEYSFFESPTKIKDYVVYAKNNNLKAIVLTDHNNVHGFAEFRHHCEENQIKAIYGIDVDIEDGRLILLAKNIEGFSEIKKISFEKSKNSKITIDDIDDKNLFLINHPTFGFKDPMMLRKKFNDFYYYRENDINSNIYIKDSRIVNKDHLQSLKIINKLKEIEIDENNDFLLEIDKKNIENRFIANLEKIIDSCNVSFPKQENMLPNFCENSVNYLENLINTKIPQRKDLNIYDRKIIEERINYEFSVIQKMNVENYFLIIADLINWAKNQNISIGPGRGSVSGSLIAYIIGITEINPLKFGLYFERFLNKERISMPDIDIDIQDDRRDEVINYLKEKYGTNNVSQICTFQRVGSKQALKDCGRFLNIPFSRMNEITKLISGNDSLKESYEKNIKFKSTIDSEEVLTKLYEYSLLIESLPRQIGVHAAGIVISKNDVIDSIPIISVDNNNVTQFSMEHIENWGLLKIDLLGLRTLTIIRKIEEEVKKTFNPNFNFLDIPLDDEKTNKLLSSSKVLGIFQLESPGMMNSIKKVGINKFEDLVDVISLFRPGPLSNIPKYIENKNDVSKIEKISHEYDQIVIPTNGIIIYQEQIMEIMQKVAGFDFAKADILRRGISKKKKEDIAMMYKEFISGAKNNNVDEEIAKKIYDQIIKFAEYGFNKSHAVAYATLSYRMAYLKTRYPLCFYSGIISLTNSIDAINKIVLEARELKFNIESPMINKISRTINHDRKNTLYLPLTFIKGVGSVANNKIIDEFEKNGKFLDFFDFVARAKKAEIGDSIIDILIESNTLREFGNMNTLINNKTKAFSYFSAISFNDKNTNEIILDFDAKKPQIEIFEEDIEQEGKNETKYLGMVFNSFPTSKFESNDKLNNLKTGIEYKIALFVVSKKEVMTKFKKLAQCIEVSDSTGKQTIWFSDKNKQIYDSIKANELGFATIIKFSKLGKEYINISKWEKIK